MGIVGIFGKPYIDLEPLLDLTALPALREGWCEETRFVEKIR